MEKNLSTRRLFLQKGLTLLAAAPTIPTFLDQTVMALGAPLDSSRTQLPSGKDGKILVVVQLSGGNDGLNTVIPYADDTYRKARPTIGISDKNVLKIDNYLGLHPNLAPLKKLYDNGRMTIVQGVGYPNPNRSHFRSMDIWHSGHPEKEVVTSGWVGRFFDNACAGCDPHVGVSIGGSLPLAMQGERITPLAFDQPDNYRYRGTDVDNYLKLNKADPKSISALSPSTQPVAPSSGLKVAKPAAKKVEITPASELDFLHRTAMDAQVSSDDILKMTRSYKAGVDYPRGEFGNGLRTVAAMIAGGLATRVYYVSLGGFDTHSGQAGRHEQLMTQLADGIAAFSNDLDKQGNSERVLVMTFSEFGRRVAQNASGGTDHGTAAPLFLFGKHIKSGITGNHPSLTNLDQGDLKFSTDFRSIYAAVLQNWLDTPSKPILGQQFNPLPVVKA